METFESFARNRWRHGDPESAVSAWHFHLRSLGAALVAELSPFGLLSDPEFQQFSYEGQALPRAVLVRTLEILRRDLPDQLLGSVAALLAEPGGRVVFADLIEALHATNDKPETQGSVAYAIAKHMEPADVPKVCGLVLDASIGDSGRFNLLPALRRRRRSYPQVEETLRLLRADPDPGTAEWMRQLDKRNR